MLVDTDITSFLRGHNPPESGPEDGQFDMEVNFGLAEITKAILDEKIDAKEMKTFSDRLTKLAGHIDNASVKDDMLEAAAAIVSGEQWKYQEKLARLRIETGGRLNDYISQLQNALLAYPQM